MDIGQRIREAREARTPRWSQQRLAAESGLSIATVRVIEAGANNPTLDTIRKLCRALDLDPRDLVAESRDEDPSTRPRPQRAPASQRSAA